jgi:hypothetical protein
VVGQRHTPAALPAIKTQYPLYRRLGGLQGRSGEVGRSCSDQDSIPGPKSLCKNFNTFKELIGIHSLSVLCPIRQYNSYAANRAIYNVLNSPKGLRCRLVPAASARQTQPEFRLRRPRSLSSQSRDSLSLRVQMIYRLSLGITSYEGLTSALRSADRATERNRKTRSLSLPAPSPHQSLQKQHSKRR